MDIRAIGDEAALLQRLLLAPSGGSDIVVPNGDDAAVVRFGGELVAVTTDTVIEGRHFDRRFSSPRDVGAKAVEAAASDIVAMGGHPRHLYLGVSMPRDSALEELEEMYVGIHHAAGRLGAFVLGGDTTLGSREVVLTVTVVGVVPSESQLVTRSGARVGDLLCVTGTLGSAAAGLAALTSKRAGFETLEARHRSPRCRIDCVDRVAAIATAMIDVSDGLSSEVHHICRMSGVGATVRAECVPLAEDTVTLARALEVDPLEWALAGGDDYELLYTVDPVDRPKVEGVVIGTITVGDAVLIERNGGTSELKNRGYDHLR